jgi:hypothetical protein
LQAIWIKRSTPLDAFQAAPEMHDLWRYLRDLQETRQLGLRQDLPNEYALTTFCSSIRWIALQFATFVPTLKRPNVFRRGNREFVYQSASEES